MSYTIGIIGGADGPTALFVTGSPLPAVLGIAAIAALIGFAVWYFGKRK